jgi:hypothetical protein
LPELPRSGAVHGRTVCVAKDEILVNPLLGFKTIKTGFYPEGTLKKAVLSG